jgi:hypothetical protein
MSISAVVRQSVEQFLDSETYETEALYSRAAEVVGRFGDKDGRDDLAAEHDAYLEDAYR